MQRAVFAFAALATMTGCRMCGTTPSEPPIQFVAKDAEAILEVRDVRVLVRLREALTKDFGAFVTAEQVDSLRQELALTLGFDPTSDEGLKNAGLRTEGIIAAQIEDGGLSAMWVLPVEDAATFQKTVKDAAAARIGANKSATEGEITVLQAEFGPEVVTVAAFAVKGGTGLVGAGPKAKELIAAALARKPEESASSNPEYQKQVGALSKDWDVRMIVPSASRAISNATDVVRLPDLSSLKSVGLSVESKRGIVRMQGSLRLDEKGVARAKTLFVAPGKSPAGIRSLDIPDAAALMQTSGDLRALIEMLAPTGSPARELLDLFYAEVKQHVGTDVESEVLPILSGHGGVAVGARDLSQISIRDLQHNPMSALWMALAVGVKEEQAIQRIEERLDPGLKERKIEIGVRKAAGKDVRVLAQVDQATGVKATLMETFGKEGAMVFSDEPAITDLVVSNDRGRDLLNGAGGLALELRFSVLAKQLTTFPIGSMPALLRGMARKVIEAVALFDILTVGVNLGQEGIDIKSELKLSHAGGQAR